MSGCCRPRKITAQKQLARRIELRFPMRSHKRVIFPLFVLLVVAVITTVTAELRSQKPANTPPTIDQLRADVASQLPIVDFDSPELADPEKRAKRKAKGKRYNDKFPRIGPGVIMQRVYHWPEDFPRLPVRESNVIVMGGITEANAYLSEDKNGVYSEFTVCLDAVLKDDSSIPLKPGDEIVLERDGGRVRYPSGKVGQFSIIGFGMPQVGRRYVLFLTRNQPEGAFHLLTGYELREGRVFPLDDSTGVVHFEIYDNANADAFLKELRTAIATDSEVWAK
jgi:hypothetical protein